MTRSSLSGWLRIGCGLALVGFLLWHAAGHEALDSLRESPPSVAMLALAWGLIVLSQAIAFMRWRFVAVAAGIPISVAEAMRLGAIGFACNFVALGNVGGDVVKAALLAKPRPGQRGAAITTVVVDRLLGLVGFLSFAATAVLWTGQAFTPEATPLRVLCQSTLVATAVSIGCLVLPFLPGRPLERLGALGGRVPVLGKLAAKGAELSAVYRYGWRSLLTATAVGLVMNGIFILSFFAAAKALPTPTPDLLGHLLVVPLAMISGALPISPNGLGTIEATTEIVYRTIRPETAVGVGTLAALSHRLAMLAAGLTGAAYYYAAGGRRSDATIAAAAIDSSTDDGSGTLADPP